MTTKKIFVELKRGIAKREVISDAYKKLPIEQQKWIQSNSAKLSKRIRGLSVVGAEEVQHALGTFINDWENKVKDAKKKEGFKAQNSVWS